MLKDRILATLRFFDLQDWPLTLLELHQFLITDLDQLHSALNTNWDLESNNILPPPAVDITEVMFCVEKECQEVVETHGGFYCLVGRKEIVYARLENYLYGLRRERRIRHFVKFLRYFPFVRGVALAGSQAMGRQKETSDIDLLILTEPQYIWFTRTLITAFFQILGLRRHGQKVRDRFCLNHYLAAGKQVTQLKNLYTAMEYAKLRFLVYNSGVVAFQQKNAEWIRFFFPNWRPAVLSPQNPPLFQKIVERPFLSSFGRWLERWLKNWQLPRIKKEEFILVLEDELSFHPQSRQKYLLSKFFKLY